MTNYYGKHRTCSNCGRPIDERNASGRCRHCLSRNLCKKCGKRLGRRRASNKTWYCGACVWLLNFKGG